jgi:hypothetical protein
MHYKPICIINMTFSYGLCDLWDARSKFQYASIVWNSITATDTKKLECIQQKFAALCYNHFLPYVHYIMPTLEYLKLHTLHKRRYHLDALFLIQVHHGSKFCPSVLGTVGLCVSTRHLKRLYSVLYLPCN